MRWLKKLENIVLIVLILLFLICCVIDLLYLCPWGLGFTQDSGKRAYLYSSLLQSLATVLALIVSLLFVAVQLSAQAYTPRVVRKHIQSFHFIFISAMYLLTTIYLIFVQGHHNYLANRRTVIEADLAVLFSAFCFTLLIPLVIRTYKLMRPKYILNELVYDISENDFRRASRREGRRKLSEKLQPIFDIIRSTALRGDVQTCREAFREMNERFGYMIRKTEDDLLSQQMARTLSQRMLEIGLFANEERKIELTMETFRLFERFLEDFEAARRRASATILYSQLKSLRKDFELRYDKNLYPVQWREVTKIFINCRGIIASIVT